MNERHLSTYFTLAISVLLIALFAVPAPAVKRWRESNINGGWQIWNEAADFDRRDKNKTIKTGKKLKKLAEKAPKPWLAEDIIIANVGGPDVGFNDYDFKSPQEGIVFIYARMMDFRGGGQSWWIALNSEKIADKGQGGESVNLTTGGQWGWKVARALTKLKKGKNTVRVVPREGGPELEALMDVFTVSTSKLERGKEDEFFKNETKPRGLLPVEPGGKLATMWATLKN